jgi:archaeal flagellar protein FlaJ
MKEQNMFKKIKLKKPQIIGIVIALAIILLSIIFLFGTEIFWFLFGIAGVIAGLPFFISIILETNLTREKEAMFLEFSRNLVESVKAGTPISKSILNIRNKDYGGLNPYIEKLANQISLGIPIKSAFQTFAKDTGSKTIARAVTIISESEKAGGQIEDILDSVSKSVAQVERLRKERRAAMYTLVVQGYIIFMIFIVIMLVMQFKILPIASSLGDGMGGSGEDITGVGGGLGKVLAGGETATPEELSRPFIWLLLVQGFFAGLVIGKLSEGKIKNGLKHSFILIVLALLISTGANVFLGG